MYCLARPLLPKQQWAVMVTVVSGLDTPPISVPVGPPPPHPPFKKAWQLGENVWKVKATCG